MSEEANMVALLLPSGTNSDPYDSHSPKLGYWLHPHILALRIAAKPLQLNVCLDDC